MSSLLWSRWLLCCCIAAAIVGGAGESSFAADKLTKASVLRLRAQPAQAEENVDPFPRKFPAPDLDGGSEWLNVAGPINLKDLRGKVVVLDFWTFCCINCMHVLPDLAFLEKKYPNELVVIGVHSAKFDNEKDTGNIRKAILRYEIAHPVINDNRMTVWRKFGVSSWPTLVLIDPEGNYIGSAPGEGNREVLDAAIQKLVDYHKKKGTLDQTPFRFDLERNRQAEGPLKFPGKVLFDAASQQLFVSDSNHHRIVVSDPRGQLLAVIGSGQLGRRDGSFAEAQFDHPQGMVKVGDLLYVADTENHLLRQVNLANKTVTTYAGTGGQSRRMRRQEEGGPLLKTALNSPWDLSIVDDTLYVAMAGPHQIWAHRLGGRTIHPYAGSGMEDITNGRLASSALAQPSGLSTDGKRLFVVDSEGSSVRQITTEKNNNLADPEGEVTTIVGTSDLPSGRALFEFGDVDGVGAEARLQHPLGIAFHDGALYVADSYNHKIKKINIASRTAKTWLGTGKAGQALSGAETQLAEPAGLTVIGNQLLVADTNNHRLLSVDLATRAVREFTIQGLTPPANADADDDVDQENQSAAQKVPPRAITPGSQVRVEIALSLPEGYQLNPLIPPTCRVTQSAGTLLPASAIGKKLPVKIEDQVARLELPLAAKSGTGVWQLAVTYGYCREGKGGLCKIETQVLEVPVEVGGKDAVDTLKLTPPARKPADTE